jgi:flagellar biosynthesis GTPase FlhF
MQKFSMMAMSAQSSLSVMRKYEPKAEMLPTEIFTLSGKTAITALVSNDKITVPVDGDRFFNKHLAVVGSTGSGKSHTIAKIIERLRHG